MSQETEEISKSTMSMQYRIEYLKVKHEGFPNQIRYRKGGPRKFNLELVHQAGATDMAKTLGTKTSAKREEASSQKSRRVQRWMTYLA